MSVINTYKDQEEVVYAYKLDCNQHLCENKAWQEHMRKVDLQEKFGKDTPIYITVPKENHIYLGIPKHWEL